MQKTQLPSIVTRNYIYLALMLSAIFSQPAHSTPLKAIISGRELVFSSGFYDKNKNLVDLSEYELSLHQKNKDKEFLAYSSTQKPSISVNISHSEHSAEVRVCYQNLPGSNLSALVPIILKQNLSLQSSPLYTNGYMPWTFSGWIKGKNLSQQKSALDLFQWGNNHNFTNLSHALSWWFNVIPFQNERLLIGATSAIRYKTAITRTRQNNDLVTEVVHNLIGEPESQSGYLCSESIALIPIKDVYDLDLYGKLLKPIHNSTPKEMSGWNSWYQFYNDVQEDDITQHLESQSLYNLNTKDFNVVYLDDGWQSKWGDWHENEKFPNGLGFIAQKIVANGQKPGIWLAPALAEKESQLFKHRQDYFLKNPKNKPVSYNDAHLLPLYKSKFFVLDTSHPEVKNILRQTMIKLYHDGFRVFKLDFLFALGYEGKRYENITSMENYHATMKWLIASVPSDAKFLLCGGLLIPSMKYGSSYRIGPDVLHKKTPKTWPFIATAARNGGNLFFLGNNGFNSDLDPLLLDSRWSDDQAFTNTLYHYLSGGPLVLSESLDNVPNHRFSALLDDKTLTYIKEMKGSLYALDHFAAVHKSAISPMIAPVLDFFDYSGKNPEILLKISPSSAVLGFFNWHNKVKTIDFDLQTIKDYDQSWAIQEMSDNRINYNGDQLQFQLSPYQSVYLIFSR